MRIGKVDLAARVLLVAEIGNNHEGHFEVAARLVHEAAACGVDAVKFQTFRTEHYVSARDEQRFQRLKRFELTQAEFAKLADIAHGLDLAFISTPFDLESAAFLEPMVDAYKIASGDNNFFPLLTRVAATGKPVIVSSGVSELSDVAAAADAIRAEWRARATDGSLVILHCVSSYPTPPEEANLRAISTLAQRLGVVAGYSDHTLGIDAAVLAVGLGARIVEKHFTLDKHFSDFRDHQLSADVAEMRTLVARVRQAERMLGSGEKIIQGAERASVDAIRRSIVAARALSEGHRLAWEDLTWTRPAGGLNPGREGMLLGKRLTRPIAAGDAFQLSDVE